MTIQNVNIAFKMVKHPFLTLYGLIHKRSNEEFVLASRIELGSWKPKPGEISKLKFLGHQSNIRFHFARTLLNTPDALNQNSSEKIQVSQVKSYEFTHGIGFLPTKLATRILSFNLGVKEIKTINIGRDGMDQYYFDHYF